MLLSAFYPYQIRCETLWVPLSLRKYSGFPRACWLCLSYIISINACFCIFSTYSPIMFSPSEEIAQDMRGTNPTRVHHPVPRLNRSLFRRPQRSTKKALIYETFGSSCNPSQSNTTQIFRQIRHAMIASSVGRLAPVLKATS